LEGLGAGIDQDVLVSGGWLARFKSDVLDEQRTSNRSSTRFLLILLRSFDLMLLVSAASCSCHIFAYSSRISQPVF
jgi:hypothetical protein